MVGESGVALRVPFVLQRLESLEQREGRLDASAHPPSEWVVAADYLDGYTVRWYGGAFRVAPGK